MNKTEDYLNQLQEVIDPIIGGGAAIASILIVKELILFLLYAHELASTMKVDSKLSADLKKIIEPLGVKKDFKVHVVVAKAPNAFTPGGKHVYITTGLLKMLNTREVMAVLLHEVYHAIDRHIWKRMATEFPLYYIAAPIAIAAGIAAGPFAIITGIIVFAITLSILKLPLTIIIGRKQEYDADNYAVKAGYGKDIASGLSKLERMLEKMSAGNSCGPICRVVDKIETKLDEHPPTKKRIERILSNAELLKQLFKGNVSSIVYKVKQLFEKGD